MDHQELVGSFVGGLDSDEFARDIRRGKIAGSLLLGQDAREIIRQGLPQPGPFEMQPGLEQGGARFLALEEFAMPERGDRRRGKVGAGSVDIAFELEHVDLDLLEIEADEIPVAIEDGRRNVFCRLADLQAALAQGGLGLVLRAALPEQAGEAVPAQPCARADGEKAEHAAGPALTQVDRQPGRSLDHAETAQQVQTKQRPHDNFP